MARPIPTKAKKKKAKVEIPVVKKLTLTKDAKAELERIEGNADQRYAWALSIKEIQSEDVSKAMNRLTDQMARMAWPPTFVFNGVNYTEVVGEQRLRSIQYRNHLYMAARMIVACAEWGVKIGNFKAPTGVCIRCGVKVKPKAKKKIKAKGKK